MPRIQTFVSNEIEIKLNDIVSVKRTEGASREEANVSNTAAMLIELGMRVYALQNERREGGFSQLEFNKIMLENTLKTNLICQKMLAINALNSEVKDIEAYGLQVMAGQIKNATDAIMTLFFPVDDS